jgi:hypothetical protein
MDTKKKIILSDSRAFYICKHLEELGVESFLYFKERNYDVKQLENNREENNSIFLKTFCNNPFELLQKIQVLNPKSEIIQSNGNVALLFENDSNEIWGLDTLISLDMLSPLERNEIKISLKSGYNVQSITTKKPKPTREAVVVFNSASNQVITIYPGKYAPPFPNSLKTSEETKTSQEFWENHVFIEFI